MYCTRETLISEHYFEEDPRTWKTICLKCNTSHYLRTKLTCCSQSPVHVLYVVCCMLYVFSNANKASTTQISPLLSPFLPIVHLAPVQARTTCFKSIRAKPLFLETFFNRIVFLWNNLSPIIRNSSSVPFSLLFSIRLFF